MPPAAATGSDQRQRDQHRQRPRDLTDDATNTEGPPRRWPILLDIGPGDLTRDPLHDLHRQRVVSWTLTTATGGDQRQRPALSFIGISPRRADTLKEALNKIIKTNE